MAVPHYTYLVLKMPSPAGVLSQQGDLKISFDCDTEACRPDERELMLHRLPRLASLPGGNTIRSS
jgi:hypothetical protein